MVLLALHPQVTGGGDAAVAVPGGAGVFSGVAAGDVTQLQTCHTLVVDDLREREGMNT